MGLRIGTGAGTGGTGAVLVAAGDDILGPVSGLLVGLLLALLLLLLVWEEYTVEGPFSGSQVAPLNGGSARGRARSKC